MNTNFQYYTWFKLVEEFENWILVNEKFEGEGQGKSIFMLLPPSLMDNLSKKIAILLRQKSILTPPPPSSLVDNLGKKIASLLRQKSILI